MTTEKTDAELMEEVHWCGWCDSPGTNPTRIDRKQFAPCDIPVLVVPCPEHGDNLHDPHDTDCWCLK